MNREEILKEIQNHFKEVYKLVEALEARLEPLEADKRDMQRCLATQPPRARGN